MSEVLSVHRSVFPDDPDRMNNPRYVAEDGQQHVDPEVLPDPHLQEHPQWRKQYRYDDSQQIHREPPCAGLIYPLDTRFPSNGCNNDPRQ